MDKPIYGLMAEFENEGQLVHACERAHEEGYRKLDAYSPLPIEELHHAMHIKESPLPMFVFAGGLAGMFGGFGLLYWIANIEYPMNIGGRPWNSWPSFIPITFETTVLAAGLTTLVTLIALCGLPQPYHPVFNHPRFKLASRDRFFLCIEAEDPRFDLHKTKEFLGTLHPFDVAEVES